MVEITTRAAYGSTLAFVNQETNFTNLSTQKLNANAPVTSGSNTYTVSYAPTLTALTVNRIYAVTIGTTDTGFKTPSLQIDATAEISIRGMGALFLAPGALYGGMTHYFLYDGNYFICLNPYTKAINPVALSNHGTPATKFFWANGTPTLYDVDANVTENTYEEFGDGATNDLTAMSNTISGFKMVQMQSTNQVNTTGTAYSLEAYARSADRTDAGSRWTIGFFSGFCNTNQNQYLTVQGWCAVNSSGVFDYTWDNNASSDANVNTLAYTGMWL